MSIVLRRGIRIGMSPTIRSLTRNNVRFMGSSRHVTPKSEEITGVTNNIHRSNAEELIAKVPVIQVDSDIAICEGGGGSLGHPVEYIKLNKVDITKPSECKYCGLRYVMKPHHH